MADVITWVMFFTSAAAVVAAGTQLARQGDRIAQETGIGGLWIGVILLATATSLPEVITDASAAVIDEPDLAVGDLFGSSMANMAVLAIIDLMHRQRRVWRTVSLGHTLAAGLAMALTAVSAAFINAQLGWSIGHVGLDTIFVIGSYILGVRVVFRHEYLEARARIAEEAARARDVEHVSEEEVSLSPPNKRSLIAFGAAAAVILIAGPFLAISASDIAEMTGIEASFVGATFLAITTSLPELVTAIAAVRLGAYDLAAGNLFGSNCFNMSALFWVDLAYNDGPLLNDVSSTQVLAALAAMFLMSVAMMGIVYRAEKRYWLVEPDAALVLLAYIGGLALLYHAGG